MGWFSPVKGSYPSLAQVDKTLPVESGAEISRGTIIALKESNGEAVFGVAKADDKLLYVSLQDHTDPTAGFAGTAFDPKGGVPSITGISLDMDGEYETSVFDTTKTYKIGQTLYVADGLITSDGTEGTSTVVGYVTAAAAERWVNNAIAVPDQKNGATDPRLALRTGANLKVLRFRTK